MPRTYELWKGGKKVGEVKGKHIVDVMRKLNPWIVNEDGFTNPNFDEILLKPRKSKKFKNR